MTPSGQATWRSPDMWTALLCPPFYCAARRRWAALVISALLWGSGLLAVAGGVGTFVGQGIRGHLALEGTITVLFGLALWGLAGWAARALTVRWSHVIVLIAFALAVALAILIERP